MAPHKIKERVAEREPELVAGSVGALVHSEPLVKSVGCFISEPFTNGSYKPEPRAYALGMEHLKHKKEEIAFCAFGGWDAFGAKGFGYQTYWVNRFHLPTEELGVEPDGTSDNLEGLLRFVPGNP